MAERVGFEPTVRLHARLISSQVHSTTLPPLQWSRPAQTGGHGGVMIRPGRWRDKRGLAAITLSARVRSLPMTEIIVPVSFGELLDKIAILQIKSERMTDPAKLANVRNELSALEKIWMAHPAAGGDIIELRAQLKAVNERLWVIEDDIRIKEKAQQFDDDFVQLARSVYFENDDRARIKKGINLALGSAYVEEKSYQDYQSG